MNMFPTYDVLLTLRPLPEDDNGAWHQIFTWFKEERQIDVDKMKLSEEWLRLYAGFYLRFPELFPPKSKRRKKENDVDNDLKHLYLGPVSKSVSTFCIPTNHARDVMAFAFSLARQMGATILDLNTMHIHRPDGFEGLELAVEGREVFVSPTLRQICDVIDKMTPQRGPSFAIIDRGDKNYCQTAGGKGLYTVEWREYAGNDFRHWVAGTSAPSRRKVSIPTNGYHVVVKFNECLTAADTKEIFGAFARNEPRPQEWVWRDITDRFPKEDPPA